MFFSKPKGPQVTDVIFLNENGYLKAIATWMAQNRDGVVAAWFQKEKDHLVHYFGQEPESRFILAERLVYAHSDNNKPLLFAGHYPLHSVEISLCESLDLKQILAYSHLDMALLQSFGGDRIKELLVKMGADENEPLSHPMISKAIGNAQEKIAKMSPADMHSNSEEDWMKYNQVSK